ncbi:MAG TPA: hypothetical protein VLY03_09125 [Bacteroidota bacterium]|nr:hypothetical protein [Bacteroidota bacterium]
MNPTLEETRERTLIEQLKSEVRHCSACGLEIRHPFLERCPRCFQALERLELSCQGCLHRFSCPVSKSE